MTGKQIELRSTVVLRTPRCCTHRDKTWRLSQSETELRLSQSLPTLINRTLSNLLSPINLQIKWFWWKGNLLKNHISKLGILFKMNCFVSIKWTFCVVSTINSLTFQVDTILVKCRNCSLLYFYRPANSHDSACSLTIFYFISRFHISLFFVKNRSKRNATL